MSRGCLAGVLRVSGGYLWHVWTVCEVLGVRICKVRPAQVRTGQVRTGQDKLDRSYQIRTGQIQLGQGQVILKSDRLNRASQKFFWTWNVLDMKSFLIQKILIQFFLPTLFVHRIFRNQIFGPKVFLIYQNAIEIGVWLVIETMNISKVKVK